MHTVRKCDFDFLTEWFYPVFRKTIFTGQYLDRSIPRSVNISRRCFHHPISWKHWRGGTFVMWTVCSFSTLEEATTYLSIPWRVRFFATRTLSTCCYWHDALLGLFRNTQNENMGEAGSIPHRCRYRNSRGYCEIYKKKSRRFPLSIQLWLEPQGMADGPALWSKPSGREIALPHTGTMDMMPLTVWLLCSIVNNVIE